MKELFTFLGCSKQAFHQKLNRQLLHRERNLLLLPIIAQLRAEHPGVAARQLYVILRPAGIGRDKFEQLCFEHGLKLPVKRSPFKTTNSRGVMRFPNLLCGAELTDANQAWASDITYYLMGKEVFYLTFIIDVVTRVIVGFAVSKELLTKATTIPALLMAIDAYRPNRGVIFHSDAGGQYYSQEFLKITHRHGFKNSMCDMAYENAYAERINGTIKNQYLKGYAPQDFSTLLAATQRAVKNYNHVRPHRSLKNQSPKVHENQLPAGGSSLQHDNFCSSSNNVQQKVEKSSCRKEVIFASLKTSQKKVNVF